MKRWILSAIITTIMCMADSTLGLAQRPLVIRYYDHAQVPIDIIAAALTNVSDTFAYDIERTVDQIQPAYDFDETCQATVPSAIVCFLESVDFEDAVRNAISLGGDADTLASALFDIILDEAHNPRVPRSAM
jgi:ADP-ribosylglycohydrolase